MAGAAAAAPLFIGGRMTRHGRHEYARQVSFSTASGTSALESLFEADPPLRALGRVAGKGA
jgi:hypothetical protein